MKGSITFRFSEQQDDYRIRVFQQGDVDQGDLEAIAAMLQEDIRLIKLIAAGEIQPTPSDPGGLRRFHEHWSN